MKMVRNISRRFSKAHLIAVPEAKKVLEQANVTSECIFSMHGENLVLEINVDMDGYTVHQYHANFMEPDSISYDGNAKKIAKAMRDLAAQIEAQGKP